MRARHIRAFTLLELVVVLAVLGVLAAAIAVPLAAQVQMQRAGEARHLLGQAREALLGFAVAHARLPCPAVASSRGQEAFAPGGDALSGHCADFHSGLLPGAALGLWPLDGEGFVRDPWLAEANRIRYAVHGGEVNGVTHALTRANGMQMATLPGLGAASHYLYVCVSGEGVAASGCGTAANQLTRRAAFVLLSPGPNAQLAPPPGSDESRNLDGDAAFVSHEGTMQAGREFDDLLEWGAIHLLAGRLVAAGRLP